MLPARLPKSSIPGLYTWIAPTHDWLAVLVEARARRLGIEKAAIRDGETLIEVAVGTALSFARLVAANPSGTNEGIDLTPAMLRQAERRMKRRRLTNYRLQLGDAYALPFPDASADLLVNSYMFDLLPESDFVPVLREFHRVLRPGGRLVQMNLTLAETWPQRLWDGLYRLHPAILGGCRGITTAPALAQAGFERIERTFVSQLTFPSEVVTGIRGDG
ncbi:MAG: methyltransferase domain-containing protein [Rhodothermales bacterium]